MLCSLVKFYAKQVFGNYSSQKIFLESQETKTDAFLIRRSVLLSADAVVSRQASSSHISLGSAA